MAYISMKCSLYITICYKVTHLTSPNEFNLSPANDRTDWRSVCKSAVRNSEAWCVHESETKRDPRKSVPQSTSSCQCKICQRMCHSCSGLCPQQIPLVVMRPLASTDQSVTRLTCLLSKFMCLPLCVSVTSASALSVVWVSVTVLCGGFTRCTTADVVLGGTRW